MTDVQEMLERWAVVADEVGRARRRSQFKSKRAAAKAARISEGHWRDIESGRRMIGGVKVPPAVSEKALEAVALTLRLDPVSLFEPLGWSYEPSGAEPPPPTEVTDRLSSLETTVGDLKSDVAGLREEVHQVLRRLGPAAGAGR